MREAVRKQESEKDIEIAKLKEEVERVRRERSEVLRDSARGNDALVHAVLLLPSRELVECERVGALHGHEAAKAAPRARLVCAAFWCTRLRSALRTASSRH